MINVRMPVYGWMMSDATVQQMVDQGARRAGFDPDGGSPLTAIAHTRTPILLIHGSLDEVVPASQSEALHAAAADHSRLVKLPMTGHYELYWTMDEIVEREAPAWFDAYLTAAPPAPAPAVSLSGPPAAAAAK